MFVDYIWNFVVYLFEFSYKISVAMKWSLIALKFGYWVNNMIRMG